MLFRSRHGSSLRSTENFKDGEKKQDSDKVRRTLKTNLGSILQSQLKHYFTPILAAGAIKKEELNDLETGFVQKQLLLPSNIKSIAIRNFMQDFRQPIGDVIIKQVMPCEHWYLQEQGRTLEVKATAKARSKSLATFKIWYEPT